jgi:hypothetical protein
MVVSHDQLMHLSLEWFVRQPRDYALVPPARSVTTAGAAKSSADSRLLMASHTNLSKHLVALDRPSRRSATAAPQRERPPSGLSARQLSPSGPSDSGAISLAPLWGNAAVRPKHVEFVER